eukprot:9477763-Pyramimonas_sp.AAC.2
MSRLNLCHKFLHSGIGQHLCSPGFWIGRSSDLARRAHPQTASHGYPYRALELQYHDPWARPPVPLEGHRFFPGPGGPTPNVHPLSRLEGLLRAASRTIGLLDHLTT